MPRAGIGGSGTNRARVMLELAILGLLETQALHGYEIRKRLRDELGLLSNLSFGSLYPALSRLERQGAVEAAEDPGRSTSRMPMTGSLSGERAALRARRGAGGRSRRGRKVYRITDEGRRQFALLLESEQAKDVDDPRSFGLRLAFARYLPPQARLRLLERRRVQLTQRLAHARSTARPAADLDLYTRSLMEHVTESTERDISWLDRLIEAERSRSTTSEPGPMGQHDHPVQVQREADPPSARPTELLPEPAEAVPRAPAEAAPRAPAEASSAAPASRGPTTRHANERGVLP